MRGQQLAIGGCPQRWPPSCVQLPAIPRAVRIICRYEAQFCKPGTTSWMETCWPGCRLTTLMAGSAGTGQQHGCRHGLMDNGMSMASAAISSAPSSGHGWPTMALAGEGTSYRLRDSELPAWSNTEAPLRHTVEQPPRAWAGASLDHEMVSPGFRLRHFIYHLRCLSGVPGVPGVPKCPRCPRRPRPGRHPCSDPSPHSFPSLLML